MSLLQHFSIKWLITFWGSLLCEFWLGFYQRIVKQLFIHFELKKILSIKITARVGDTFFLTNFEKFRKCQNPCRECVITTNVYYKLVCSGTRNHWRIFVLGFLRSNPFSCILYFYLHTFFDKCIFYKRAKKENNIVRFFFSL